MGQLELTRFPNEAGLNSIGNNRLGGELPARTGHQAAQQADQRDQDRRADEDNSVSRELALIKVRADAATRGQIIEAVNLFRAKVVDVSAESLVVEATGTPGKLEALLALLEPYGIREMLGVSAW